VATPTVQVLAEWIVDEATNTEFKPLREVIETVLSFRLQNCSPEERSELAERLMLVVATELEDIVAKDLAEGVTPSFEVSTEGVTAYFRVLEAPEVPVLGKLRNLPADNFEAFCAKILTALGADASVTGGPHDGGVDFVALNLQLGENVRFAPRASQAMVIGQAKRYKEGNNITLNDMREFIGAAILRAGQLRGVNSSSAGVLTPIVYAYWTTSDFHQEARKYARAMGIWYLNGRGLTQLAQRAGVGIA